ncbi:MAG: hypothetical protein QM676_01715 [Novosphingobium sp.]
MAQAQPVDIPLPAATTTEFPAGITVAKVPGGQVYVDAQGRTLYGMDMRMVARWSVDTSKYCEGRCQEWEPVLAPAGSKPNLNLFRGFRQAPGGAGGGGARPAGAGAAGGAAAAAPAARPAGAPGAAPAPGSQEAQLAAAFGFGPPPPGMYSQANAPDWSIVDGPAGPQYVYKGYNMVYVRKGDKPHSTAYEGADGQIWNTLKFVPPVPRLTAPAGVGAVYAGLDKGYILTHKDGVLLYTGKCGKDCAAWKPLAAGTASQGIGEWTVDRTTPRPQWLYRGKPVFVAADDQLANLPRATVALRP